MKFKLHYIKYGSKGVEGHNMEVRTDIGHASDVCVLSFDDGKTWIPSRSLRTALDEAEKRAKEET